jgi:hypothetical protein
VHHRSLRTALVLGFLSLTTLTAASAAGAGVAREVTAASPDTVFPRSKQNEPAVAVDPSRPNVVVAGVNEEIDNAPCGTAFATPDAPCPFTPGVGGGGVMFSFDRGHTWNQPTYSGWTARAGRAHRGPIGTVPWYLERGLVSDGDPALAFGPVPDRNGRFSWANGSRLYYSNLASNFPTGAFAAGAHPRGLDQEEAPERARALREQGYARAGTVVGAEGIAVSSADNVTEANFERKSVWSRPVIVSKQIASEFADKEQIWADNAASSPFFGTVYVCYASFIGDNRQDLTVSVSHDGGSSWNLRKITPTRAFTPQHFGVTGCTVRTNSHGVAYLFFEEQTAFQPGRSRHLLARSYDGGRTWTRPHLEQRVTDLCFFIDPVILRCMHEGVAGARNDLGAAPNVDIANGAPTGAGATNRIVNVWVDGTFGLNHERVLLRWAVANERPGAASGLSWHAPQEISTGSDRGYYTAPALSPDGTRLYVVYNAYTNPFRRTTFTPRGLIGVTRAASFGATGPSGWTTLYRSPVGDPRASSQNDLTAGFLGDYVYAAATNSYGVTVWNDVRNGAVCPVINDWRQALRRGSRRLPPNPATACPARFGNTDIWSFTTG